MPPSKWSVGSHKHRLYIFSYRPFLLHIHVEYVYAYFILSTATYLYNDFFVFTSFVIATFLQHDFTLSQATC